MGERRDRGRRRVLRLLLRTTGGVLLVFLLYLLSIGPVTWAWVYSGADPHSTAGICLGWVYTPAGWILESCDPYRDYVGWFLGIK